MIEPALTAEQWSRIVTPGSDSPAANAYTIALANAALPDSDPRKITWAKIDKLRELLQWADDAVDSRWGIHEASAGHAFVAGARLDVDALASYMPPRGTPQLDWVRGTTPDKPADDVTITFD